VDEQFDVPACFKSPDVGSFVDCGERAGSEGALQWPRLRVLRRKLPVPVGLFFSSALFMAGNWCSSKGWVQEAPAQVAEVAPKDDQAGNVLRLCFSTDGELDNYCHTLPRAANRKPVPVLMGSGNRAE
jgi:hypothetical protein